MELLPSLLEELKAVCGTFPDTRQGRGANIAMADFGLSAFSLFFMQSESFLPSRPGEFHPEPLTDFGLDTLASSGWCHRTKAAAFR